MAARCANGETCVAYRAVGEPAKLAHGNPGPSCFACVSSRTADNRPAASQAKTTRPAKVKGRRPEPARARRQTSMPPVAGSIGAEHGAEQWYTVEQAADLLGVGGPAVRERIRRGKLPAEKKGREWRKPLDAMLRAHRGPNFSALILTELLAQRVAALLREDLLSPNYEIAGNRDQYEPSETVHNLGQRLGEEITKREMAEKEVERLRAELAARDARVTSATPMQ